MIILHHSCFFWPVGYGAVFLNTCVSWISNEWNHGVEVLLMTKYHLFTKEEL